MLTSRHVARHLAARKVFVAPKAATARALSTPAPNKEDEAPAVSPVVEKVKKMRKEDKWMVYGTEHNVPAPILPETPKELAWADPADLYSPAARKNMDGTERTVVITQEWKETRQAPLTDEKIWHIKFQEESAGADRAWKNSLMGWTSTADPYLHDMPLKFDNAAEAVYFARKRGWKYEVREPIKRVLRDDGAQYQDNFLSQALANRLKEEGTSCKHWERSKAGTSHYFRPLKYHGSGTVRQHGIARDAETAKAPEPYYKPR